MPRVALATTDGKFINEHFGRAKAFHIVNLKDNNYFYMETREVTPCCQDYDHNESDFDKVIELLSDCDGVFVSRIGTVASTYLIAHGLRVFEAPGIIEDVMKKVIADKFFDKNTAPQI
jgi:predicted Fe-Mo cluster-binding NifX family protein